MNRSRRTLSWTAALCVLSLLAACGPDSTSGSDGGGTLDVVALNLGGDGENNPMRVAAADFEAENPGVEVEVTLLDFDQFDQVVRAQLNGGSPPDVIQTVLGYGNATALKTLAEAKLLTDLSDEPWADSVAGLAVDPSSLDGKLYAFPPMLGMIGAIYDQEVFDEIGVTAPTTYSEVLDYCETMQSNGVTPIALGAQTPIAAVFAAYAMAASTAFVADPEFNENRLDGGATFAEGWAEAFEQLDEMNKAGCFGSSPTGVSYQASLDQVAAGDAGMVINVIEGLASLQAINPDADFKMVAMPSSDDPAEVKIPAAPSAGFAIPAKTDNATLAREFIEFLSDNERSATYARGAGSVPLAGIESIETAQLPPAAQAMADYVAGGRTMIYPSQYWPVPEINVALEQGLTGMLSGQNSPQEIGESMDAAWEAIAAR